jgi:hypothetical protein
VSLLLLFNGPKTGSAALVTPGVGALTVTGYAPTVITGTAPLEPIPGAFQPIRRRRAARENVRSQSHAAAVAALLASLQAPDAPVVVTPGVGALEIVGYAPTVIVERRASAPNPATLTLDTWTEDDDAVALAAAYMMGWI